MKYARQTCAVGYSGGHLMLSEGQPAEDDHPLVKERPELFTDEAPDHNALRAPERPRRETAANRSSGRRANAS